MKLAMWRIMLLPFPFLRCLFLFSNIVCFLNIVVLLSDLKTLQQSCGTLRIRGVEM